MICLPPLVVLSLFAGHSYTMPISGTILDVTQYEHQPNIPMFALKVTRKGVETLVGVRDRQVELQANDEVVPLFNGQACLAAPDQEKLQ